MGIVIGNLEVYPTQATIYSCTNVAARAHFNSFIDSHKTLNISIYGTQVSFFGRGNLLQVKGQGHECLESSNCKSSNCRAIDI